MAGNLMDIPDGRAPEVRTGRSEAQKLRAAVDTAEQRGVLATGGSPTCTVTLSGTSPAPNSADKVVLFDGFEQNYTDDAGNPMWSSANPDQIVIRVAGRYRGNCPIIWSNPSGNIAGQRIGYILRNATAPSSSGSATIGYDPVLPPAASGKPGGGIAANPLFNMRLGVGDILRVSGWHNQGGDLVYQGNSYGGVMRWTVEFAEP